MWLRSRADTMTAALARADACPGCLAGDGVRRLSANKFLVTTSAHARDGLRDRRYDPYCYDSRQIAGSGLDRTEWGVGYWVRTSETLKYRVENSGMKKVMIQKNLRFGRVVCWTLLVELGQSRLGSW
jgi:hypothetical protein